MLAKSVDSYVQDSRQYNKGQELFPVVVPVVIHISID
jgi:hypothetical protein